MPTPLPLLTLARDALCAAGRYDELLAALDAVPSIAAIRGNRGKMLLHTLVGSEGFDSRLVLALKREASCAAKSEASCAAKSSERQSTTRFGVIEAVFNAHPDALQVSDDDGMLPIHHAAMNGSVLATQYLIEKSELRAKEAPLRGGVPDYRAPESSRDAGGMLPVHLALEHRAVADVVLELLYAHGGWMADHEGNEKDGHGWELIHLACAFGASPRVVRELLADGRNESALMALCPINCRHNCPRCTDTAGPSRGAERAAHATTPTLQMPARPPPARPDQCVHALPIHLAARCGARLGVIKALVLESENVENCQMHRYGHIIDQYGYLPSDYAIAAQSADSSSSQGAGSSRESRARGAASSRVVEELFALEAAALPDSSPWYDPIDCERRRAFAAREPERRARRQAEPEGTRSGKRPCVRW